MTDTSRVLPPLPYPTLDSYVSAGGGVALEEARAVDPEVLIGEVAASGLRGRGGAGFPTGRKWQTVVEYASDILATNVVVNGAEGEPGTLKDRRLMVANPYAVLEGALIAARAVGARDITVAVKASFTDVATRLRAAIAEIRAAGWLQVPGDELTLNLLEGPDRYLFGEETALLEVVDGRPPLPRVAPPYRHGTVEVITDREPPADEYDSFIGAGHIVMAGPAGGREAPPTLVNNVETLANVPAIIARGAAWFREVGTADSPGTMLVTATGSVRRPGVYEVALGTTLTDLIELAGGPSGPAPLVGVLGGVSSPFLADLTIPISYEAMQAAGTGLGSGSFCFVDGDTDPLALAAGVSRFLAVESCGQCTPCKLDGLKIARGLRRLCANEGTTSDATVVAKRLTTVADGARCNLGRQHQAVVTSILEAFPDAVTRHLRHHAAATQPVLIAETLAITDAGVETDDAVLDADPAWSGLQTGPDNPGLHH